MTIHSLAETPQSDPRPLLHALADRWWLVLLRGVAGVAFGAMMLVWPGLALVTLVLLYGSYAIVDGVFAILAAFTRHGGRLPAWWLILAGTCGIVAGLSVFMWPGMSIIVLTMFVGAWALIHGVLEIAGAIRLRHEIDNEWLLILAGALSVIFGVLLLMAPGTGAISLIWMIGFYTIVFGGLLIGFALRLKQHQLA